MENASKALIMAGGVLMALIVIGVLVLFFNNLSSLQNTKLSSEQVEQAAEFNKKFDVYARDLYGSELLSLANMIVDYNTREADNKGYSRIDMEVTFKRNIDDEYFKGTLYAKDLSKKNKSTKSNLENMIDELGKKTKSGANSSVKTISELAKMRQNEIKDFLGLEENDSIDSDTTGKIKEYITYKNLLSEMKQTLFEFKSIDYDDNTGRITKIYYELPEKK